MIELGARVDPPAWMWEEPTREIRNDVYARISPRLPPYEHQRRAVNDAVAGVKEYAFHALFMEMGTGKTKSTIDAWTVLVGDGAIDTLIVVAPKSIMSTWTDEELPKHASIPYSSLSWDGKSTKKSIAEFEGFMLSKVPKVYVVNVEAFQQLNETLRERLSRLLRGGKCLMVIDESSSISHSTAQRSKVLVKAGKLAAGRLILTGTEISKGPLDLYMQFEFLHPGFWGTKSFFMFRAKYAILQDAYGAGGRTFKKVVGYQKLGELTRQIEPHTTRALKAQCLDLPEKIRQTIFVELTETQDKMYRQLKSLLATELASGEIMTVPNKIALFTKFRQLVGGTMKVENEYTVIEPKPGKLTALLDDLADTDEQAIIWCAFRGEIQLVSSALASLGTVVTFDGSTDVDERSGAKVAFQSGEARFFVSNMKAGAYGLNLQNCHLQYFYSRDTSPQANWQAEDRSHRPGQKHSCVYKSLVVKGTVDERILELIEQSADLRDIVRGMSAEDIVRFV